MKRKQKSLIRNYAKQLSDNQEVLKQYKAELDKGIITGIDLVNIRDYADNQTYVFTIDRQGTKSVYPLHTLAVAKKLLETLGVVYYVEPDSGRLIIDSDVAEVKYEVNNED